MQSMLKKIHIRSLFKTITFPYINQIYTLSIHKIFARNKKFDFLDIKIFPQAKLVLNGLFDLFDCFS